MKINIKKLTTTAKIPTRGSEYAAGYDLYADITKELVIEPHETAKIGTGLSIEIPDGYFGAVFARSGLAAKQALRPANCVGVCCYTQKLPLPNQLAGGAFRRYCCLLLQRVFEKGFRVYLLFPAYPLTVI